MVARMDAAPPMSHFMVSMPFASLIDRPPESNAIPLPVSAMGVSGPRPCRPEPTGRGGFTRRLPTPRMPPNPPFSSPGSPPDLAAEARPRAPSSALRGRSAAGGMSPAGVFTRSRAQQTALAERLCPRLTASRARPWASAAPRTEHHDACEPLLGLRCLVAGSNRYAPRIEPLDRSPGDGALGSVSAGRPPVGNVVAAVPNRPSVPATRPPAADGGRWVVMASALVSDAHEQDRAGREPVAVALWHDQQVLLLLAGELGVAIRPAPGPSSFTPGPASGPFGPEYMGSYEDAGAYLRGRIGRVRERGHGTPLPCVRARLGERRSV